MRKIFTGILGLCISTISSFAEETVLAKEDNWVSVVALHERFEGVTCEMSHRTADTEFGIVLDNGLYYLYSIDKKWKFDNVEDFANTVTIDLRSGSLPILVLVRENTVIMPLDTIAVAENDLKTAKSLILGEFLFGSDRISVTFPGYEKWTFATNPGKLIPVREAFRTCMKNYFEEKGAKSTK